MIPKVSDVHYGVRLIIHISNINTLQSIYYALPSNIKHGIIFGGNSFNSEIFPLQKTVIRIMDTAQPRI